MRKSHKKALGLLGLATVVGMTTVAANLPTPAGAVSSVTDTISVTVVDNVTPEAAIVNIANGTVFTRSTVKIFIDYTNLKNLTVKLKWGDASASAKARLSSSGLDTLSTDTFAYANRTGTKYLEINLDSYGGYNDYELLVSGDGYNGGTAVPSSVNFRYTGASIEGAETGEDGNINGDNLPVDESNGDPVINIETSDDVDKVIVQVVDAKNGEVVYETESDGKSPITLPFEEKDISTGKYEIVITGKDKNDETVGSSTTIIYNYQAPQDSDKIISFVPSGESTEPVIKIPDIEEGGHAVVTVYDKETGEVIFTVTVKQNEEIKLDSLKPGQKYSIVVVKYNKQGEASKPSRYDYTYNPNPPKAGEFLRSLNISRADYLTTGAIIFGLATIAAFFFLRKKKGNKRR